SKERVCDENGEFSTDSIGDFIADLHTQLFFAKTSMQVFRPLKDMPIHVRKPDRFHRSKWKYVRWMSMSS
ncbi:hypothetical protein, partial [Brevibacillus sp. LEMMJ03]|uniref:hypothetical protein n=1 Tax=Brevibacillus sp. LEMMJ03 TaxID=2595056 RepID=UPI001C8F74B5